MVVLRAKPGIDRIKPHMAGGGAPDHPPPAVLLNSNESAFGPSPAARAAMRDAVNSVERYLEHIDTVLAPPIAERFDLDVSRIAVGQGSDDLLARLARAYLGPGDELIRTANGYLKVPNYAYANGAEAISVADDAFVPSVDRMIGALTENTRIVYLANPENPAGTYLSGAEVRRLHAALPASVLLVIDAAYEEYVDAPDYASAAPLVEEAQNVVMCRTFSKIYGLAGARVGWMYGAPEVVDTARRIGLTFPVASPAAAAAIAALDDVDHVRSVREANRRGRDWITAELTALGLTVVPSQANFVLVRFPDASKPARLADQFLRRKGIAVRRFASPAYEEYIRISIGLPQELRAVRDGIAAFLRGTA